MPLTNLLFCQIFVENLLLIHALFLGWDTHFLLAIAYFFAFHLSLVHFSIRNTCFSLIPLKFVDTRLFLSVTLWFFLNLLLPGFFRVLSVCLTPCLLVLSHEICRLLPEHLV